MQNDNHKADFILDGVGGNIFEESTHMLNQNGKLIASGASSGNFGAVNCGQVIDGNQTIIGFNMGHYLQNEIKRKIMS